MSRLPRKPAKKKVAPGQGKATFRKNQIKCANDIAKVVHDLQANGLALQNASGDSQLSTLPKVLEYLGPRGLSTYEGVAAGYLRIATRVKELKGDLGDPDAARKLRRARWTLPPGRRAVCAYRSAAGLRQPTMLSRFGGAMLMLNGSILAVATMTSREIADLTGSSHDSVLKTVRRLNAEGVVSGNETPYQHPQNGQSYYEYRLSFRDTMVVVSGYSAELRAKIIDRWQELEVVAVPQFAIPTTLSGALRLAAEQAETIEAQAAQLLIAAPAVAFVDSYVASTTGSKGFREVCKLLKANESEFREFLLDRKIMYRLNGAWTPHAAHLDADRFEVKTGTKGDHVFNQAKFTPKGIKWVAGEFAKYRLDEKD